MPVDQQEEFQLTIQDFEILSEWMDLPAQAFGQELSSLGGHPRVKSAKTQKALAVTLKVLEALHKKYGK